ncbi:MAG: peroxiredoxin [Acidobacteriota bacterium]
MRLSVSAFASRLLAAVLSLIIVDAGAAVPAAGATAPAFSLPDQTGKSRSLAQFRGKWVVLYFYPKDGTPGCTEQACRFRDDIFALEQMGAQVVGVSLDDSASHAQFAKKYNLPFPLLADTSGAVSRSYGALTEGSRHARRYTFLIDPAGKVAKAYTSVETSRHSIEVIEDLMRLSKR